MSLSDVTTRKRGGRKPARAKTERGRAILASLEAQGLTLQAAARKSRLAFPVLFRAIHGDPDRLNVQTIAALCGRLGLPLALVAPPLAKFSAASVA